MEFLRSLADFMTNNFYTGDPNVDSWLFIGLVVIMVTPIFLLIEWAGNKIYVIKFKINKARFLKAIDEGREPGRIPIKPDGSYDITCLVRSKEFKEHIKAMDGIVKNSKKT